MEIAYLNGNYLPADEIKISPDDRGFLFSDGIYEVVRWYEGFFYDMEGHTLRLKRSLQEVRINWTGSDSFPSIAQELIKLNELQGAPALVYLQVTRGAARRSHAFPLPSVPPTVYAFARGFNPQRELVAGGIGTILLKDPRWNRCDIKSVALLPNILSFQEAREKECYECLFVKDGFITECAHSNAFFVVEGTLFTHPESEKILSGITRKNVLRIAREAGIRVNETPFPAERLNEISEAFVTNTSFEIAPVISINKTPVGNGKPGPVTAMLRQRFDAEILALRTNNAPEA
ncbi:MAG: aminotransferase class IV [Bacteroidales bacterium]|nr:aminotransferase class IV [Bacteroidales bacterium]